MTKLLGVIISNGLSSENRVFATLLSKGDDRYDARVLMHQADGDGTAHRFAQLSGNPTTAYDTGWRPSPYARRGNPLRLGTAVRYWREVDVLLTDARVFDPDVVYSSQQHVDCRAATKIARQTDAAQIIHLHYTVGPWLRRTVLERLRTTDLVISVSEFIREQAISHGVAEDRVVTLHNAVEPLPPADERRSNALRRELDLPDDAFTFGMVSRIDEGKGHAHAIEAFERIAGDRPEAQLVIVGSGRIDREIRRRVDSSPASNQIIQMGFRTDVDDLLGVFDALIHPAFQDPCPLAVLEAMAAGLPVVGYDDGGVPELVESGETGILVAAGNTSALGDAMSTICSDRSIASEFGEAGRERLASRFTPERAGRRFAEIVASQG
ncbi:MAG: glycosyltransferase family 4 protein [Ilumatobacter sp.]|nr:glycosyltransferase family 4 protein [Ilumatobacter sp.]